MEQEQGFIDYIEQSIIKNWDRNALTDYKGITLQYKDVARKNSQIPYRIGKRRHQAR